MIFAAIGRAIGLVAFSLIAWFFLRLAPHHFRQREYHQMLLALVHGFIATALALSIVGMMLRD